jgi:DNA-directed RNA polymerase subunit H (RpoH/RPB5)
MERTAALATRVRALTSDLDYASQLTSLISEQALTDDQARTILKTFDLTVLAKDLPYLKVLSEVARYEGFNPREIIRILLDAHTKTRTDIEIDPNNLDVVESQVRVGDAIQDFTFTSNMDFHSDMQFICLMFITRGAAFDKIMKKSNSTMQSCMNLLKTKYNINTMKRKPGQALDGKTITIPRIAASFPTITVGLFTKGYGRSIVDPTLLFPDVELPKAVFAPMVSSVIPKIPGAPLAILLAIAVRTDDVLHQTEQKTTLTALHQYLMASFNSTAVTELVKAKCSAEWGIVTRRNGDVRYVEVLALSRERAREIIRSSRPNDASLEVILAQV